MDGGGYEKGLETRFLVRTKVSLKQNCGMSNETQRKVVHEDGHSIQKENDQA